MKHNYLTISALAAIMLLSLTHSTASAQTAPTISYQGMLQSNGANVNGTDTLKILIYIAQTGGSPIYSETQIVPVQNGIFNLAIGAVTPLIPALDFTKQYYLAVSVNSAPELSPRSEVGFAPYAFRALNADTASYSTTAAHATIANTVSGGVVTSVNGLYGSLSLSGTNGITVTNNNPPNIIIGSTGVQSVNTAGGKITLVGSGGTTIADTGTTITIHSATFTGGTGIQAMQNSDSSITITNGSGPIATVSLGHQNASSGQVLEWNGSTWKPATLSDSLPVDSIKNLQDARDDGSSVFLGAGSGVNNSGKNSNVALGIGALHAITTGYDNTAMGDSALARDTLGAYNVAIGMNALENYNYMAVGGGHGGENVAVGTNALQSMGAAGAGGGGGNTAIGSQAMMGLTGTASDNTACGFEAMYSGGGGSGFTTTYNSAFGLWALYSNSGSDNSGFGRQTLYNNSGSSNVAVGSTALVENRTGSFNTALGYGSMLNNDSGSFNVGVGYAALWYSWERSHLVAIGDSSLYRDGWSRSLNRPATLDSGTANTAVGDVSLFSNSTGSYNTGVGYHVLFSDSIGYRNTALGYLALNQNATGNDNTAIGSSAGPTSSNLNNTISLGSGAQPTASNEVVLGNANVTSLYCQGAYAATTASSANMVVASNGQIMRSTSSARYKTDIHDLDINTDKLYDLRPVSYTSKIDGKEYFGLVAEDVAKVIPDLAEYARAKDVIPGSSSDEMIPDAVKYPMLSVLLLEELKKEHARAEEQEKINANLERRLEALEASHKSNH